MLAAESVTLVPLDGAEARAVGHLCGATGAADIAAAGLWSLAQPDSVASEYLHAVLGALLLISPWVLSYSDLTGAAWTSWVAGALTIVVGLAALPAANAEHRGLAGQS